MAKKKAPAASPPADAAEYTVLARRYRPQQFADLVGQEPVAQALENALKSNRVAHAYLFTGARGVGKTSTARIFAKALNCERGPTITPCDQCEMCRAIMSGDDTDVLEIDGASNTGVDHVRELRANVQYRPSRARYKIYIIDEVHMLSTAAFNALLKTLEEPPSHVKFIFATTEANKIPVTILSRCQRFDFVGIGPAQILDRLRSIVASENMAADDETLEWIARRAAGSMRDAQSLLDQLLAFGSAKLTVDRIHELLGTAHEERVAELAAAIVKRDAKQALALLGQTVDQGQQLGELLDQLIEYWRDLMVVQCAGSEGQSLSVTSKHRDALKKQADSLSSDTVLAGLDVLVSAKQRLRGTSHGRVVIEIALVRLCQLDNLVSLSQLAQWVAKDGASSSPTLRTSSASSASRTAADSTATVGIEKKKPDGDEVSGKQLLPFVSENVEAIRQQLIIKSGLALGSDLRRISNVAISAPNTLVLSFPARYNQRSDQILDAARRAELEELLHGITGQACQIRIDLVAEQAYQQANGAAVPAADAPYQKARRQRAELMQLPLVSKAMDVLGAQIVGVDDEFGKDEAAKTAAGP
jgi:DNA polymerase-3 subunit gamma/tau